MNIIFFGDAGDVTLRCIFSEHLCFFPGGQYHACNTYAYIQKISYCHAFFDKDHLLSFSTQRKNFIYFEKKKYHLCRYFKIDRVQARMFWKDNLFRTFEENIIFPGTFWERSSFFLCLKNKIIFPGKRSIILLDTRKIIFQCDFLERSSFQNIWKMKIYFSVLWKEDRK